jgi:hypothetical protein
MNNDSNLFYSQCYAVAAKRVALTRQRNKPIPDHTKLARTELAFSLAQSIAHRLLDALPIEEQDKARDALARAIEGKAIELKKRGRPKGKKGKVVSVYLHNDMHTLAYDLGDGNVSEGIRRALKYSHNSRN